MPKAEIQFTYFKDLEKLTKSGLMAYLILMIYGLLITIVGIDTTFYFITNIKLCESLLLTLISVNLIYFFLHGINKIHGLGELHIWLDKKFFGFLHKSNEIILRELLVLLEPHERSVVESLVRYEQTAIAQTIFSHLAENQSIFERLLKRGIFRSWIWYWIAIYGLFVFILLTLTSFSKFLHLPTIYSQAFLISIVVVTALHLIIIYMFGYNLLFATKRIMREIINLHYTEILTLLRSHFKKNHNNLC